jgi:hypothetical protein
MVGGVTDSTSLPLHFQNVVKAARGKFEWLGHTNSCKSYKLTAAADDVSWQSCTLTWHCNTQHPIT